MRRLFSIYSLFKNYDKFIFGQTYYEGEKLKSKIEITLDQLYFALKFGELAPFYFTYGFDRKSMTRKRMLKEYITPYYWFEKRVDYLNWHNPRYDKRHEKFTGRVITGDKFYFNIFLNHFGIPTPKIYLFIKDGAPLYVDPSFEIRNNNFATEQIKDFLSYDMDAFAKPSDGQLGNGIFAQKYRTVKYM